MYTVTANALSHFRYNNGIAQGENLLPLKIYIDTSGNR